MAHILCTGAESTLVATRRLILERCGHVVATACNEAELRKCCTGYEFQVIVVGQAHSRAEKQHLTRLIREHFPNAKVLEIYAAEVGPDLDDADDWLAIPKESAGEIAARVTLLLGPNKTTKAATSH